MSKPRKTKPYPHKAMAAALEQENQTLRERLDEIRQLALAAARRLEMGAALEREHCAWGLPKHLIPVNHAPNVGENLAWRTNAEAVATWLRGEAEILHRLGEGLE